MPVQKLIANTTNEGLKRIREELGRDTLILKTVKRNGKVEFYIQAQDEVSEINAPSTLTDKRTEQVARSEDDGLKTEYRDARLRMLSDIADKADRADTPGTPDNRFAPEKTKERPSASAPLRRKSIQRELTVKGLIEGLELTPGIGARLRGYKRIDEVVDNLALMIRPAPSIPEGIRAFVGPAGTGKTTTLIKLITRHVMQFGEDSCAIINCDRYRMGAKEQLTRLGELMGVDVLHVGPGLDLNQAIANVHKRRFVAIDMPGLGMQDQQLSEELFRLGASYYDIQRYLVMPANLQFSAMQLAHNCFSSPKGTSCILTRMDETSSLGAAISFIVQNDLPLAYTSDGPHIPEDISQARGHEFLQSALALMDGQFAKEGLSDLTNREQFRHKEDPNGGLPVKGVQNQGSGMNPSSRTASTKSASLRDKVMDL